MAAFRARTPLPAQSRTLPFRALGLARNKSCRRFLQVSNWKEAPLATAVAGFRGVEGERITSTFRDPSRNRAVGGVPNSYHMRRDESGNAMARDSVPPPGMNMSEYARRLQAMNPHLEVINEGDHVHMEPRG